MQSKKLAGIFSIMANTCENLKGTNEFHSIFNDRIESGPEVIKLFSMLNSAEHEIFSANKYAMPTIVGIFIFISREIFMLSYV